MIKFSDLIFLFRKSSSNKLTVIWAFFFFIQPAIVSGQTIDPQKGLQISLLHKGDAFWHRSNQLGINDQGGYISLSTYGSYNNAFNYGLSGIGNFNETNNSELLIGFVSKNIKDYNLTFSVLLDPSQKVRKDYFIMGLPTSYLIGADGKLKGFISGAREWNSAASKKMFSTLVQ